MPSAEPQGIVPHVEPPDDGDGASTGVGGPVLVCGGAALVAPGGSDEVLHRILAAEDASDGIVRILGGHEVVDLVFEPVQRSLGPRIVAQFLAEGEVQGRAALHHALDLQLGLDRGLALEPCPKGVARGHEVPGGILCRCQERGEGQESGGEDSSKHAVWFCSGRSVK